MKLGKLAAAAVAVILLVASCASPQQDQALQALNRDRNYNGLRSLAWSPMLQRKAQGWADHLASVGSLSHSNLTDGIGGCWRSIGENVGYGPSVEAVESAYMNSPGHRANILNNGYGFAATGVAWRGGTVYTVQEFLTAC